MEFFDTHAHLTDPVYSDQEEVISRARQAGVKSILTVGFNLAASQQAVDLAAASPGVYAAVGIHPHEAKTVKIATYTVLEELTKQKKVVAWGEIGLDYYRNLSPPKVQMEVFRYQLRLAKKLKLPVIIHVREAYGDVLRILREEKGKESRGVIHCFSGDWPTAQIFLKEMDFYLSLGGPVTYPQATRAQEVARLVPLDRLLLETDCPYLAPQPQRGRRNEPAFILAIAEKVASLRQISLEKLAEATTNNAYRLFRLK